MNRLSTGYGEIESEKTTTNYSAPSVGSLLAVPSGQMLLRGIAVSAWGTQGIGLGGEGSCELGEASL